MTNKNSREKHVQEIKRIEGVLAGNPSKYLRRDYEKALKRLRRELKEYDRLQDQYACT